MQPFHAARANRVDPGVNLFEGADQCAVDRFFRNFGMHNAGLVVAVRRLCQGVGKPACLGEARDHLILHRLILRNVYAAGQCDLAFRGIVTLFLQDFKKDGGALKVCVQRLILVEQQMRAGVRRGTKRFRATCGEPDGRIRLSTQGGSTTMSLNYHLGPSLLQRSSCRHAFRTSSENPSKTTSASAMSIAKPLKS